MLTSLYFIWFAFWVVSLTVHATILSVVVHPFIMALELSWRALSSCEKVSTTKWQWVSNRLFFRLNMSMILRLIFYSWLLQKKLIYLLPLSIFYHIIKRLFVFAFQKYFLFFSLLQIFDIFKSFWCADVKNKF
jgi:hypothetical protein